MNSATMIKTEIHEGRCTCGAMDLEKHERLCGTAEGVVENTLRGLVLKAGYKPGTSFVDQERGKAFAFSIKSCKGTMGHAAFTAEARKKGGRWYIVQGA